MPNLASALKSEMSRLARKEIKAETGTLKKAAAQFRRDIANLKRTVDAQAKTIAYLRSQESRRLKKHDAPAEVDDNVRYSSKSVRAQRRRLGLSAPDFGALIGVTGQTIYNWEKDVTRPQEEQLAKLVEVRSLGKREAVRRLEMMEG